MAGPSMYGQRATAATTGAWSAGRTTNSIYSVQADCEIEIYGSLPNDWVTDIAAYSAQLLVHVWGGHALERLVIGEVGESLREWLPDEEFRTWEAQLEGRMTSTGAKAFLAKDGRPTAVVAPYTDRLVFLELVGHEMVELVLDQRHKQEGHAVQDRTHAGASHVLWTEYVAERTRRSIANELGWGYSPLETGLMLDSLRDFEAELPTLIAAAETDGAVQRAAQYWFDIARYYCMSLGRSDAGCDPDDRAQREFRRESLTVESDDGWRDFDGALREAYELPDRSATELDELVADDGWRSLHCQFRTLFNTRYHEAQRRRP